MHLQELTFFLIKASFVQDDNDQKSSIREYLINKVSELPINDISSIKVIASALSAATSNTEQVSRGSAVKQHFLILFSKRII